MSPHSDLIAVPIQCSLSAVDIAVSNAGSRPGIITTGWVERVIEGQSEERRPLAGDSMATILSSGSAVTYSMSVRDVDPLRTKKSFSPAPFGKSCQYQVIIDVLEFGSSGKQERKLTCECPD